LPDDYRLELGRGTVLADGGDAIVFAYGPVMLAEALGAHDLDAGLRVVDMPWLNRVDDAWIAEQIASYPHVFVVEDHSSVGGLGDFLLRELARLDLLRTHRVHVFGVDGIPACGTPAEALRAHRLDAASLVERIAAARRG